jgi:type IV pilus assembly protein PilB
VSATQHAERHGEHLSGVYVHALRYAADRANLPGADALPTAAYPDLVAAWRDTAQRLGITPDALAGHVAEAYHLALADLGALEAKALKLLPERLARQYQVLPLRETDRDITVATADPEDLSVEHGVAFASGRSVIFEVASPLDIADGLATAYADGLDMNRLLDRVVGSGDPELVDAVQVVESMEPEVIAERDAEAAPVVKLTSFILRDAVVAGASDVHIEPGQRGKGVVRFRIDGLMREYLHLPIIALNRIVSRIKVLAKLDIADRLRPQDGRTRIQVENKAFDLRVSTVPTRESENAVIRILRADTARRLEELDMAPPELARVRDLISHHEGIVLVTGPTGSGKTTTLYAALKEIASGEVNVITVEDPIEYELPGVTQIQVEPKRGVTFATALRAILRQDPDVIFIGEIRDGETAEIAAQAAMTGHLVLASLHTNDAVNAVGRLADLGLDRPTIAATLRGALAQRLVRRVCSECAAPANEPLTETERHLRDRGGVAPSVRAVGCKVCGGTGYRGRVPVLEVFVQTPESADAVASGATIMDLRRAAVATGMRVLRETALQKVAEGVTTLEEVDRVVGIGGTAATADDQRVDSHVLIVDDDPMVRLLAKNLLEHRGMAVDEANDGASGEDKLESAAHPYQLAIIDLLMPGMDGETLLRRLRAGGRQGLPVIVLTGTDDASAEARLLAEGADDYIRKPIDPDRFVARVHAVLRRAALQAH